jgi:hypothetical protein
MNRSKLQENKDPETEKIGDASRSGSSSQAAIRRAQALVRSYIPEGRSLADELVAERKGESHS